MNINNDDVNNNNDDVNINNNDVNNNNINSISTWSVSDSAGRAVCSSFINKIMVFHYTAPHIHMLINNHYKLNFSENNIHCTNKLIFLNVCEKKLHKNINDTW